MPASGAGRGLGSLGESSKNVVERVTHWEDGRAVGLEVAESGWPIRYMHWVTRIEPKGAGARITQRLEYAPKYGPLGWLLDKLVMKRKLTATLDDVFARLAKRAEAAKAASRQPSLRR